MLSIDCPRLFTRYNSSCSWRVRIALTLKNIQYLHMPTGRDPAVQTEAFRQLNPLGQVPALQLDGHTLIDSLAIMYYLEETRPEPPLLPVDVKQRALMREICGIICYDIQPLQGTSILERVEPGFKHEFVNINITRGFDAIEKILEKSAGTYCVGNQITMADCCLLPQVHNAERFGVPLILYQTMHRIAGTLRAHPAFENTRPSKQPDFPPPVVVQKRFQ